MVYWIDRTTLVRPRAPIRIERAIEASASTRGSTRGPALPIRTRLLLLVAVAPLVACGDGIVVPERPFEITEIRPPAGASSVPLDATATVRFTRPLDPATVDAASVRLDRLRRDGARRAVRAAVEIAPDGRSLSVLPVLGLAHNSRYELALDPSIAALGGADAFGGRTATFSTARIMVRGADARGDTFGTTRSANGPAAPDVVTVTAAQRVATVLITVELAEPVGEGDALVAVLEIDADQDPSTGFTPPVIDRLRPANAGATGLGVEYGIELDADGTATVFDLLGAGRTGVVQARLDGRFVSIDVPYALLGDDDGNVDLAIAIGTAVEATDVFPDDGSLRLGRGAELAARGVDVP